MFSPPLPSVRMTSKDIVRLRRVADRAVQKGHPVGRFLVSELDRALVLSTGSVLDCVRLDEWVYFQRDGEEGVTGAVLLLPEKISGDRHQLSVLSPMGAALIGLKVGTRMPYMNVDGTPHNVTVIRVGTPLVLSLAEHRSRRTKRRSDRTPPDFSGPSAA